MIGRLPGKLETLWAVWLEARVWVDHLVGEGPATLRRQREAAAAALAAQRDLREPRGRQQHAAARPVDRGHDRRAPAAALQPSHTAAAVQVATVTPYIVTTAREVPGRPAVAIRPD
jgi:hypothetical protein